MRAGERVPFVMWCPSHASSPPGRSDARIDDTIPVEDLVRSLRVSGPWRDEVMRSITLKALTSSRRAGGRRTDDVAAGAHWRRGTGITGSAGCDATYTLCALMIWWHTDEASAWRNWLPRAVAGDPSSPQIYGMHGERRLTEQELCGPGYDSSRRCGSETPRPIVSAGCLRRGDGRVASRARAADQPRRGVGAQKRCSSSRTARREPDEVFGRCATAATSPIQRSWPGLPSIARSKRSNDPAHQGPSIAGVS